MRVDAHRAGAVERQGRGDILEVVRLHHPQQGTQTAAVELEDAEGVAAAEQLVGGRVGHVLGQRVQVDVLVAVGLDVGDRVVEDGEVAQPQEVHLDQPERLAGRVVELGDDLAVLLPTHDRDDVDDRVRGHDDAGGVHAPLPLQALQPAGGLEDLGGVGVLLEHLAQLGGLDVALVLGVVDAGQRDALAHDVRRHRLGQLLAHRERVPHHAGGVLERLLGLDRAVGDDHRHPLVAVLLGHIVDDLAAATIIEVDVEVGHGHTVRVEEALEEQSVLQRIEVGDAHGVGDHGAGSRTTAGSDADAVVLRPVDEVGDDEEVAAVALPADHLGLVGGLPARVVGDAVGVAPREPGLDLLDEPAGLVLALGHREAGHVAALALGEGDLAALGDQQGVVAGLGQLAPDVAHLLGGLQVVAVAVELEPVGVAELGAGRDAQQRPVRVGVGLLGVVQVVGGQQRQRQLLGQLEQVLAHDPLDVDAVVHQLEVVVVLADDVAHVRGVLDRLVPLPHPQPGLDLPRRAAGGRDEPLAVGLEQLAVHPRLEVVALDRGQRGQPEEVVHAVVVARQQRHVRVGAAAGDVVTPAVAVLHPGLVGAVRARGDVGLEPDDRLDAVLVAGLPELVGAEDEAVVGRRDRRHPLLGRRRHQLVDPGRTVEHGVLGVVVEVDEALLGAGWR